MMQVCSHTLMTLASVSAPFHDNPHPVKFKDDTDVEFFTPLHKTEKQRLFFKIINFMYKSFFFKLLFSEFVPKTFSVTSQNNIYPLILASSH